MVTDILAGTLLGVCIALVGMAAFIFIARRKCWIEIRIAPDRSALCQAPDHVVVEQLTEQLGSLQSDFDYLEGRLAPYLDAAAKRKE